MPYRLSSLAEQDLDEVWLYVAEDASPTTADRLLGPEGHLGARQWAAGRQSI